MVLSLAHQRKEVQDAPLPNGILKGCQSGGIVLQLPVLHTESVNAGITVSLTLKSCHPNNDFLGDCPMKNKTMNPVTRTTTSSVSIFLISCLLSVSCVPSLLGQQVKIYVTSKAGDRLTLKPSLKFEKEHPYVERVFRINKQVEFQTVIGWRVLKR
jgi:hypothetical protein